MTRLRISSVAEDLLAEARDLGRECTACQLDVGRRHAILLAAMGEHAAALAEIDECLADYRKLGPGHDLNNDGVASCLSERGKASLRAAAWTSRVFTHVSTRCHAAEDLCGESCHQIRERFRIS